MLQEAVTSERHGHRHTAGQRNFRLATAGIPRSKREPNVSERRRGLQIQRGPVTPLGEEADKHDERGRSCCPRFERETPRCGPAEGQMGAKGSARRRYNGQVRVRQRRSYTVSSTSWRYRFRWRRRRRRFER